MFETHTKPSSKEQAIRLVGAGTSPELPPRLVTGAAGSFQTDEQCMGHWLRNTLCPAAEMRRAHPVVDGAEDLLDLADLRLVLQEDGRVEVGHLPPRMQALKTGLHDVNFQLKRKVIKILPRRHNATCSTMQL
jgi:hypothetical protein